MSLTDVSSGTDSKAGPGGNGRVPEGVASYSSSTVHQGVTATSFQFLSNTERSSPAPFSRVPSGSAHRNRVGIHKPIDEASKRVLREAFYLIIASYDSEMSKPERSNCFDEWKDLMETIARKEDNVSMNHRKILGSLISVTFQKDISDFDEDSLKIFQRSTYLLRQPRITRRDSKNVIAALLERNLKVSIPMAVDGLGSQSAGELDEMMDTLIEMSGEEA